MKKTLLVICFIILGLGAAFAQACNYNFNLGADVSLCANVHTLSAPAGFDAYVWNTGETDQSIDITTSGTYTCTISQTENSLVNNGDFSQGNIGFLTDYTYGTGGAWGILSLEGTYAVVANPNDAHTNFAFCYDHTFGDPTGNMLVVNGSANPGTIVWEQTISVDPNTDYLFSFWAMSVVNSNPAILNFIIDGINVSNDFQLGANTCNWELFQVSWNSGAATSVQIGIGNENSNQDGNDFAIDDIEFAKACVYQDEIEVVLESEPIVSTSGDVNICAGSNTTLTAQSNVLNSNFVWNPGNLTGSSITVSPNLSTTYSVVAHTPAGCISQPQTVNVDVSTPNGYNLALPASYISCSGEPVQFDLPPSNGGSFQWSPAALLNNSTSNNPIATANQTTQFTVVYTNNCGEQQTASTVLYVLDNVLDLGNNFTLCEGTTRTINLPDGPTYTWQDGSHDQQYTISEAGLYMVTASFGNCSVSDMLMVTTVPVPIINITGSRTICPGEQVVLAATLSPNYTYLWSTSVASNELTTSQPGTYSIEVTDLGTGCTATESVVITPLPRTRLEVPQLVELCEATTLHITVGTDPGTNITWDGYASEPRIEVIESGIYTITATGPCGTISKVVEVYDAHCEEVLYVPNAFTPNEDGVNDIFKVYGNRIVQFKLWIFDHWGNELFYTEDLEQGWNGNNTPSGEYYGKSETYVYRIELDYQSQKSEKLSGSITLLR